MLLGLGMQTDGVHGNSHRQLSLKPRDTLRLPCFRR